MKYPLRTCKIGYHQCRLCKQRIELGQQYYDGGYNRRFHKHCVEFTEDFIKTAKKK